MKFTVGQYCILTELVDREHKRISDKLNEPYEGKSEQLKEYLFQLRDIQRILEYEKV